jgi:hypothetical protein
MTLQWSQHDMLMSLISFSFFFFVHLTAQWFMTYSYCVTEKDPYVSVVVDLKPHVTTVLSFINTSHTNEMMIKERPTKCIFKVNHTFRILILLLYVSALQERHLQGAQSILMKLCACYVISAK